MRHLYDIYEEFGRGLLDGTFRSLSFRQACRLLKVAPADLEEIILEENGMGGEEVLALWLDIGSKFI